MGTRPASYAQRIHLFPRNQQRPVTPETPLGFPPRLCIRKPHLGRREISPPNVRSQAEHLLAPPSPDHRPAQDSGFLELQDRRTTAEPCPPCVPWPPHHPDMPPCSWPQSCPL